MLTDDEAALDEAIDCAALGAVWQPSAVDRNGAQIYCVSLIEALEVAEGRNCFLKLADPDGKGYGPGIQFQRGTYRPPDALHIARIAYLWRPSETSANRTWPTTPSDPFGLSPRPTSSSMTAARLVGAASGRLHASDIWPTLSRIADCRATPPPCTGSNKSSADSDTPIIRSGTQSGLRGSDHEAARNDGSGASLLRIDEDRTGAPNVHLTYPRIP
jgi:hypothetical protein